MGVGQNREGGAAAEMIKIRSTNNWWCAESEEQYPVPQYYSTTVLLQVDQDQYGR